LFFVCLLQEPLKPLPLLLEATLERSRVHQRRERVAALLAGSALSACGAGVGRRGPYPDSLYPDSTPRGYSRRRVPFRYTSGVDQLYGGN